MNLPWTKNKELLIELAKLRERNSELEALASEQRLVQEELETNKYSPPQCLRNHT